MSFFASLERSTVVQLVATADSSHIQSLMPCSMRVLESCSRKTSRRSLRYRYPCSVTTSAADLFINCLVTAGLCKDHDPNGNRFSTIARYSSSAKSIPSWDENMLE